MSAHPNDPTPTSVPPPPPPPPPAAFGLPIGAMTASSPAPAPSPPRRPWRTRLPEAVAAVGAGLVILALIGFISSTWALLGEYPKALALGAAAAGLTVAGLWADQSGRRTFTALVPIAWATATAVLVAAVHVGLGAAAPDALRAVIAIAGVVGVAHAATLWQRRPGSFLLQLSTVAAAVFAVGPIGTRLADRYDVALVPELFRPLVGLLDPTVTSDTFVIVAAGHLLVAIAWLGMSRVLPGAAAHTARVGGSALLAYAAMEFNVLANPMGAVVALVVVLGYLVAGIVLDDLFLIVVGTIGALTSGVKVIWALFSGEVAVTLTVFSVGLAMLAWAWRAAQHRDRTDEVVAA